MTIWRTGTRTRPIAMAVDDASLDAQYKWLPDQTVSRDDDGRRLPRLAKTQGIRLDVDGDGVVKPLDALILINWMNLHTVLRLTLP